ncbi:MAG: hypothetical protein EZS28_017518 [Streblomastix strix]|uniref:Tyr recombinase domain-containing protein n=1 Tax=Streblomastix strix TaxID=222440 RepID=A0A5J4VWE3_9EUKA|nr:MAG: hypothetical protein EZS28_017518 [Streblomastix strix]
MKKDAEVILTEVFAFYIRQNNSVASAKSHKACLTTMLSLIYKENLASSTTSKLINKALANASIPHRRYQNIWNIQILFKYWRQSKQIKPNEIAEIRLKFSNVDKTENQASLRLAPKQANAIETYEVYVTDNEKLSPKLAKYEWIDRLKKQFPKAIKKAEDSNSVFIFNTTLGNNRVSKPRANDIARQLTNNPGKVNE